MSALRPRASAVAALPLLLALAAGARAATPLAPTQLPTGGTVTAGTASISRAGATLTVDQTSARAAITWNTFDIGAQATVDFVQPSAASVTLDRVLAEDPSRIFGALHANGQVFLVDPAGVYFGAGARVDVGGLVATTAGLDDSAFMAGRTVFTRSGATGAIINAGAITAGLGGYVALLAPRVSNEGVIIARLGTVALAGGDAYSLGFNSAGGLADVIVTPATVASLIENGDAIRAPGGLIILTASAASALEGGVVNNTGAMEADGLTGDGGTVRLTASDSILQSGAISADAAGAGAGGHVSVIADTSRPDSSVTLSGSITARGGPGGGAGGQVETSGGAVHVDAGATVDTRSANGQAGAWLLDPTDFTIAASGGDITGAQLEALLAMNSVTIETTTAGTSTATNLYGVVPGAGTITVRDNVTWKNTTLTLSAAGDIDIDAIMTSVGGALRLNTGSGAVNIGTSSAGFTGEVNFLAADGVTPRAGSDFLSINGQAYTVITSLGTPADTSGGDLQGLSGALSGFYALGANIDASATASWNGGAGFSPVGGSSSPFTGVFDGLGHTITGLAIDTPSATDVGLFGATRNATLRNVAITQATITGQTAVGGLVGLLEASGAGGEATISDSFVSGAVSASMQAAGGLAGEAAANSGAGASAVALVRDSYANATVTTAQGEGGGLVGLLSATGVGATAEIEGSYATGAVSDNALHGAGLGGLVGVATDAGSGGAPVILDSYATGAVTSYAKNTNVGGLVGQTVDATITDTYAAGGLTIGDGAQIFGALIGATSHSVITGSFYDSDVNGAMPGIGQVDGAPGGDRAGHWWGLTTAGMRAQANFDTATAANGGVDPAWDFTNVWSIATGVNNGFPYLVTVPVLGFTPAYVLLVPGSSIYGTAPDLVYEIYSNSAGVGGTVLTAVDPSGAPSWSAPLSATSPVGAYAETYAGGLTAGGAGYKLFGGDPAIWSIDPAALTITASPRVTMYGQALDLGQSAWSAAGLVNGDSISGVSLTYQGATSVPATTQAGVYAGAIVAGSAAGSGLSNYTITYAPGALTVQPAPLTITADPRTTVYGQALSLGQSAWSAAGLVNGDSISGVSLSFEGGPSVPSTTPAGVYDTGIAIASAVGSGLANYAITYAPGVLTVQKATLTVTPDNQARLYGQPNPVFTETISGYVNGENAVSAGVTGSATGSSLATVASAPGDYVIVGGVGTLLAANYAFIARDGTLTIDPAPRQPPPPVVTFPGAVDEGEAEAADLLPDSVDTPADPDGEEAADTSPPVSVAANPAPVDAGAGAGNGAGQGGGVAADGTATGAAGAGTPAQVSASSTRTCPPARPGETSSCPPHKGIDAATLRRQQALARAKRLAAARRAQAARVVAAAHSAAINGNEPTPGDALAESFEEDVWTDNSDPSTGGKSHAVRDQQRLMDTMTNLINFTLFLLP